MKTTSRALLAAAFLAAFPALPARSAPAPPPAGRAAKSAPPAAAAEEKAPAKAEACLECHEDPDLEREAGGKVRFDKAAWAKSIHLGAEVECVECHADLARASFPHPAKLAPATCVPCHDAEVAAYGKSVHASSREKGGKDAASCVDCHGDHDILPAKDPASRTNHFRLPETCARCHADPELIARANIKIGDPFHAFEDSIHGRALNKSGLAVAPNCSDCHRAHDIRDHADPQSPVRKQNVAATCGRCHQGILPQYQLSIHATQLASGNQQAPACADCHTAHGIRSAEQAGFRLDVLRECGSCHDDKMGSYRDTYHGKVTELGFERTATCSDCHGAHAVLPRSDPRSTIADANRTATCAKCHPGANDNFAAYDPHVQPHDRERNAFIFWTQTFMNWMLIGVFSFFGIHTFLWLTRETIERRRGHRPSGN